MTNRQKLKQELTSQQSNRDDEPQKSRCRHSDLTEDLEILHRKEHVRGGSNWV